MGQLNRFGLLVCSLGALSACQTVTFPETPLPFARAADGRTVPPPITFVIDTSYRHFDDATLHVITGGQPGDALLAWGRYPINRAGANSERNGYKELTVEETADLRAHQLRLLPIIAPDQKLLARGTAEGAAFAKESAAVLLRVLHSSSAPLAPARMLVFLDVEGDADPISDAFLLGWCQGLGAVQADAGVEFLPAVYTLAVGSTSSRRAVAHVDPQCHIAGLWLARYRNSGAKPTAWPDYRNSTRKDMVPFPDDVPIYAWQYWVKSTDPQVDLSMVNPGLVDQLAELAVKIP